MTKKVAKLLTEKREASVRERTFWYVYCMFLFGTESERERDSVCMWERV